VLGEMFETILLIENWGRPKSYVFLSYVIIEYRMSDDFPDNPIFLH